MSNLPKIISECISYHFEVIIAISAHGRSYRNNDLSLTYLNRLESFKPRTKSHSKISITMYIMIRDLSRVRYIGIPTKFRK
jgi:hypothetical protein